jgi:hypothetical protein
MGDPAGFRCFQCIRRCVDERVKRQPGGAAAMPSTPTPTNAKIVDGLEELAEWLSGAACVPAASAREAPIGVVRDVQLSPVVAVLADIPQFSAE